MDSVLIPIHGVKRAGKNTVANALVKLATDSNPALSASIRGFADKAKLVFARQFFPMITMDEAIKWVDKYKDTDAEILVPSLKDGHTLHSPFRLTMAQFASEGIRDSCDDEFWVKQLIDPIRYEQEFNNADLMLVTDLRFLSELEWIDAFRGSVDSVRIFKVKVSNPMAEQAVIDEAKSHGRNIHASEVGLSDEHFDYIIHNHTDLPDLFEKCRNVWQDIVRNTLEDKEHEWD